MYNFLNYYIGCNIFSLPLACMPKDRLILVLPEEGECPPASCKNHCGHSEAVPPRGSCFCDEHCQMNNDCCEDYSHVCARTPTPGNNTNIKDYSAIKHRCMSIKYNNFFLIMC